MTKIANFLPSLFRMIIFTMGFKYLTENLIKDLGSLAIDFSLELLEDEIPNTTLAIMIISLFIIMLKIAAISFFVIITSKRTSRFIFLHDGVGYS